MLSMNNKNIELLAFILVIIGAINWAVTAFSLESDAVVPDLLSYLIGESTTLPLGLSLHSVQLGVYYAVALAGLYLLSTRARGVDDDK